MGGRAVKSAVSKSKVALLMRPSAQNLTEAGAVELVPPELRPEFRAISPLQGKCTWLTLAMISDSSFGNASSKHSQAVGVFC